MDLATRAKRYKDRGFDQQTAAVNVLIEEALQALFSSFPNTFVYFGGSSLVLFYESQRHSGDLDLLVTADHAPEIDQVRKVLNGPLNEIAASLDLGPLHIDAAKSAADFERILVKAGQELLFTVDLTRISAAVNSEVTKVPLAIREDPVLVALPTRNLELLFKAEAFLTRSALKVRDAFDIKLLLDSGAVLNANLKAHLVDGSASEHFENPEFISGRIEQINRQRCEAELRPFLPKQHYEELERLDFKPLRDAATFLFSEWLER